jgi:hypothetical protein
MKVKVNRQLSAGKYHVNFEVGDFATEEIAKMSSFGVPTITLRWTINNANSLGPVGLTQINRGLDAIFDSEQAAKKYQEDVLAQIKAAIERLRGSKDEFSASEEVNL